MARITVEPFSATWCAVGAVMTGSCIAMGVEISTALPARLIGASFALAGVGVFWSGGQSDD